MKKTLIKLVDKTKNQVNVLYPYRSSFGVWAFDDAEVGLQGEPFVGAINTMIDMFTGGDTKAIFYISHSPIGEQTLSLTKEDDNGHYSLDGTDIVGWLCPATFKYFEGYPEKIYARIERLKEVPAS